MSHFAKISPTEDVDIFIVVDVIVAEQSVIDSGYFGIPSEFIQTSYNTRGGIHYDPITNQPDDGVALRANYASIAGTYNKINDVFYSKKPLDFNGILCESWSVGEPTWLWTPPIPRPKGFIKDNIRTSFYWDETNLSWIEYTTPTIANGTIQTTTL